jgi:hypothetical protein
MEKLICTLLMFHPQYSDKQNKNKEGVMELQEFITETLTQVIKGIKNSQEIAKKENAKISPSVHWAGNVTSFLKTNQGGELVSVIKFNISLSAHRDKKEGTKAGIFVTFAGISANLDEAKGNSSLSNIQFEIPVVWPFQD